MLWYLAQLHSCLGVTMPEVPADTDPAPELLTAKMMALIPAIVKAGRLAEHAKKAIRDDSGTITDQRAADMQVILGMLDGQFYRFTSQHTHVVASANLAKLASRKERGVLGGSGDNR